MIKKFKRYLNNLRPRPKPQALLIDGFNVFQDEFSPTSYVEIEGKAVLASWVTNSPDALYITWTEIQ